jgi:hypothetical protein
LPYIKPRSELLSPLREMVLLSVFGDESADSINQRVFAVAGLLGDEKQWASLNAAWVERTGGKVFHASDCESDGGDFIGIPHKENLELYKDLTGILANSKLIGFGVAIDLVGCRTHFPDMLEENPYLSCLLRVVKFLSEKAGQCVPSSDVEFTFDQNTSNEFNAGLIYQYLTMHPDWKPRELVADKLSFATRKTVSIQAADLWAREVMKRLEWELYQYAPVPRRSWTALYETRLYGADFLMEGFYKDLKSKIPVLEQQTGVKKADYRVWLKNRQDNQSNRILYLMYTEETEQATKDNAQAEPKTP